MWKYQGAVHTPTPHARAHATDQARFVGGAARNLPGRARACGGARERARSAHAGVGAPAAARRGDAGGAGLIKFVVGGDKIN